MTSHLARFAGLIVLFVLIVTPPEGAIAQSDPVVAKVNGVEIKQSDLKAAEEDIGQQLPPLSEDAKRDYLITYVGDMILVAKAAEGRKLADTAEFKQKLALARTKLLMEALLQVEAKAAVTDAAMRKVYDDATKEMAGEEEVSARHILVETEDQAKAVLADLKKGGDFAAIAKEKSKDPGSKDEWRRSRLLRQGPDGAGIRRSRLQARQRAIVRSGKDAVRLAHHPGRGQAQEAIA